MEAEPNMWLGWQLDALLLGGCGRVGGVGGWVWEARLLGFRPYNACNPAMVSFCPTGEDYMSRLPVGTPHSSRSLTMQRAQNVACVLVSHWPQRGPSATSSSPRSLCSGDKYAIFAMGGPACGVDQVWPGNRI